MLYYVTPPLHLLCTCDIVIKINVKENLFLPPLFLLYLLSETKKRK